MEKEWQKHVVYLLNSNEDVCLKREPVGNVIKASASNSTAELLWEESPIDGSVTTLSFHAKKK